MNKLMKGNWALGLGVVVGSSILFPLALYLFNLYKIDRNDAAAAVKIYIDQSINIKTTFPQEVESKKRTLKLQYARSGDRTSEVSEQVFYFPAYKKYFTYEQFDKRTVYSQEDGLYNKEVIIRVNQNDLLDPALGTRQNPVPLFNVWPATPLLLDNAQTGKTDTIYPNFNQQRYIYNVTMYLTFVMPKDEFKKRFDKNTTEFNRKKL